MIDRVAIKNYRGLRSVECAIRPLTVLVGPNDSGKSSFLAALRAVIAADQYIPDADFWRRNPANTISIEIESPHRSYRAQASQDNFVIEATDNRAAESTRVGTQGQLQQYGNVVSFWSPYRDTLDGLSLIHFQLPIQGVGMVSAGYNGTDTAKEFGRDGSGVPSFLDYLLRKDRKRFFSFVEEAKRLIDGLDDVDIETPDPSSRRLDFVIDGGLRIEGEQASAGVRLLIFFIALLHHPSPPKVILIEEPETGIHPRRIVDVMKLLRKITLGEVNGHAAQVILTTHSPYLLDCVNLDTDQVLVFRREEDGSRTASPVDAEGLKDFLHDFQLGEVWYNEGEAGLVAHQS